MDFKAVLEKRKSVRSFQQREVEEEKIEEILKLVSLAPSAGNLQSFKIFIIKDPEKKEKLEQVTGFQHFLNVAPVILVFCTNQEESASKYNERGRKLYSLQDATIACAYAQLTATSLGLASCWVGAFNEEEVQKILGTNLLPVALLPLGYPAEDPPRLPRKSLSKISKSIEGAL